MKIIATIGPASMSNDVIKNMILEGVSEIRINFSHFHESDFKKIIKEIKSINSEIKIIADICGKKIRVDEMINGTFKVYPNEVVYFCSYKRYAKINISQQSKGKIIPLTLEEDEINLSDIRKISMKDNTMLFNILDKRDGIIKAKSINGGVIRGGKGCNIPNIHRNIKDISINDKKNILWAIREKISIICQSYVESREDVLIVKKYIEEIKEKDQDIKIISKIETPAAVENIKEIAEVSQGILIGRGDLSAECGLKEAVYNQEKIIIKLQQYNYSGEIIIATHLLDNMIRNNISTYTEVESIYSFIKKGITSFMLTGETSIGYNPVDVVKYLKKLLTYYKGKNDTL